MPTFSINERNEKILFKLPNSETYLLVNNNSSLKFEYMATRP